MMREVVVAEYEKRLPSAVKCFVDDFEACIAHLRFPIAQRRVIRTTILLERLRAACDVHTCFRLQR
jgi:putative transposase